MMRTWSRKVPTQGPTPAQRRAAIPTPSADRSPEWTARAGRAHDRESPFPLRCALPNLIVYIDRRDGAPTPASLFALSEARRMAHVAGLTVFALVLDEPQSGLRADDLTAPLGRAGADRVLLCEGAGLGAPPLDVTHGRPLFTAAERVPPIVVLFPAGGPGDELGPPLAMRLGAAYAPAVDVELSEEAGPLADGVGRVHLRRWRADRTGYRQLDPVELERPIVAILGAMGAPRAEGTPDIDVEVIACASVSSLPVSELASEPDELDQVSQAWGLVILAPEVPAEVGARLRAAAPAGVAVVDGTTAPGALAAASPAFVLEVGRSAIQAQVGISPRARMGLVRLVGGADPAAEGASGRLVRDFAWAAPGGDPWSDLIAALGAIVR
jgi:hypothetical protein